MYIQLAHAYLCGYSIAGYVRPDVQRSPTESSPLVVDLYIYSGRRLLNIYTYTYMPSFCTLAGSFLFPPSNYARVCAWAS